MRYKHSIPKYEQNVNHIPLKKNTKEPAIAWKEYQDRKYDKPIDPRKFNIGVVTGKISQLVVVDADTKETVSFLEQFEAFKKTAKVKTKRGIHYYFKIPDYTHIQTTKIYDEKTNIKIDIKADGSYVVAPPSIVDDHQYEWISDNGNEPEIIEMSEVEFLSILQQIQQRISKTEKKHTTEKTKEGKVDWEKLAQAILRRYSEGHRQDIVMCLAGWLGKMGIPQSEVIDFVYRICDETGDPERKMRIAAVIESYEKIARKKEVKGISGLVEAGYSESELTECINPIVTFTAKKSLTIEDIAAVISSKYQLWYDEFSVKFYVGEQELTKEKEVEIHCYIESFLQKSVPTEKLQRAIEIVAYRHKRDRLKNFLLSIPPWDGVSRIEHFFEDVFGVTRNEYTMTVAKNFFVSLIARAMEPGCFQKHVLVLVGPQNIGKSRAMQALGREFYREINVSITTEKDFYMSIQGVWLAEMAEMDALRKADRNRVKSIISTTSDRFRPPYSRIVQDFPRRCVFVVTTNDTYVYEDPTGGTRFWVIECPHKANIEYIHENREQLFAEALYWYQSGWKYWEFNGEAQAKLKEAQEWARKSDEWETEIENYIRVNKKTEVTIRDIALYALNIDIKDLDKNRQMRIAEALRALGFRKETVWKDGKAQKIWVQNSLTT